MDVDLIIAGVGGQGILSIAYVIDLAALSLGLNVKQSEAHGMSQRGGAVVTHLRLSSQPIYSDLVPRGRADLILSTEPLESLRYVDYLSPYGAIVSGIAPTRNIPGYPDLEGLLEAIAARPRHALVPSEALAREAGSARAQNIVMLGTACQYLGAVAEALEDALVRAFAGKDQAVRDINVNAFRAGRAAGRSYRECLDAGMPPSCARQLLARLRRGELQPKAAALWTKVFAGDPANAVLEALRAPDRGRVVGHCELPAAILSSDRWRAEALGELLFRQDGSP